MQFYKFTVYFYLIFALLFIYNAYEAYTTGGDYWFHLVIAAFALFMFVFRLRFFKRMEERRNNQK